jgi:chorismate dehydratase
VLFFFLLHNATNSYISSMSITLGIPNLVSCSPLSEGLRDNELFSLVREEPPVLAHRLETRALAASFLSPIEFARNASEYFILRESAVVSPAGNSSLVMYFRGGIHDLTTLAVPPTSVSDIVLAKILLAERFDVHPRLVPVAGSVEAMLAKADAALVAGDDALTADRPDALDLIEEWIAATDLPYVHGFVAGREDALTPEARTAISGAALRGGRAIAETGGTPAALIARFDYAFSEDAEEGLTEFMRYAYYHGILPDVPDIRFY